MDWLTTGDGLPILVVVLIAVVFLLAFWVYTKLKGQNWRVDKVTVNTGVVSAEIKQKKEEAKVAVAAPTVTDNSVKVGVQEGGVVVGGAATLSPKGDIAGTKSVGRDNIQADNITITQAPEAPPPPRHGWFPPVTTPHYIPRGIEQQVRNVLTSGDGIAAIVSVYAPGGTGKTEMASRVCTELEKEFGHVWWIDCGDKTPSQVLTECALLMGFKYSPNADEARQVAELDEFLGGQHDLMVLDDVRDKNRELLDKFVPPAHNALLITSRLHQLSDKVKRTFPLDELTAEQARELLTEYLGTVRVQAEAESVEKLIERCARNPLALDIAAARILEMTEDTEPNQATGGTLTHIARFVARLEHRLQELKMPVGARRNLEAVLDLSYEDLSSENQMRFRRLGACASTGFGLKMAAALWEESDDDAREALRRLRNASLVKLLDDERQRYRLHDLLDDYAAKQLREAGEENKTRDTHGEYVAAYFGENFTPLSGDYRTVLSEWDNLGAAAQWANDSRNGNLLAELATQPRNWFVLQNLYAQWGAWATAALELGIGEENLRANTRKAIGDVQRFRDDNDAALASYQQALALFQTVGSRLGEANTLQAIGDVQRFRDDNDAALASYTQALALYQTVGELVGEANTLQAIGDVQQFRKDMDAALASYTQALALYQTVGSRLGEANTRKAIGDVQQFRKDMDAALASYTQALALYQTVGELVGEANTLQAIGDVQQFRKDMDAALASYTQALALYQTVGELVGEANTLRAIGDVQRFRDDNDAALASYTQALALFQTVGDRLGEANVQLSLGDLFRSQDQPAEARLQFGSALELYKLVGDRYSTARALYRIGDCAMDEEKWGDALAKYQEARELWLSIGLNDLVGQILEPRIKAAEEKPKGDQGV